MNNILCEKNFNTKYAYVNNICVDINNIETIDINNLKCKNGHCLIPVCGNIKKHYFRHKNTEDLNNSNKSIWHCEWQGYFEDTEISFPKINENQIMDRRADIFLKKYNKVIEIQHSKISEKEVNNRKNDYTLNNIDTIWVIDGEDSIIIKKLNNSNRIYLEFVKDYWKYESFIEYDFIFIDIDELIYKIYPKNIKSYMTDIENPKSKDEFINNYLKNNIEIWENEIPIQCNMYIKQEGAGNGKTYGIIQMLENDTMYHYNNFIYITKQHSAKNVMYEELIDQTVLEDDSYSEFIDENVDNTPSTYLQALRSDDCARWQDAINSETDSINQMDTFEFVDLDSVRSERLCLIHVGFLELNSTVDIKLDLSSKVLLRRKE